jgi:hypothetical protein
MQPTDSQATATGDHDDERVAETLRAAAQYLAEHGWIQGSYYDPAAEVFTPAACLVGAIAIVCYGGPNETPAEHLDTPEGRLFEATLKYLDAYLLALHGVVAYEFSDEKGRTVDHVLMVLDDAADIWCSTHGGGR